MKYFFAVVSGLLLASFSAAEQIKVTEFGTMKIEDPKDFRVMVFCTTDKGIKELSLVVKGNMTLPLKPFSAATDTSVCFTTDSCEIWSQISKSGQDKIADLMGATLDGTLSYTPSAEGVIPKVTYYGGGQLVNIPQANVTVTQKVKPVGALYFNGYSGCTSNANAGERSFSHGTIFQDKDSKAQVCQVYKENQTLSGAKKLGDYHIRLSDKLKLWTDPDVEETFTCSGAASSFVALTSVLFAMLSTVGFFRL